MSFIQIPGLADSDPVPGVYTTVQFAQGAASSGTTNYSVCLLGNRLSTGSAQDDGYIYGPDTTIQLQSEADAIALFGAGSELHIMIRRFLAVNKSSSLYAVCVKESTGSQASGTVVITGPATASCAVRVQIGTDVLDAGVVSGDTATAIGDSLASAINGVQHLSVTAANVTGTVTITAKQKGLRGNEIRVRAQVIGASTGISVTRTNATALSGGTTADTLVNALATISSHRFYYQVPAADDATQLGLLSTQINANASPIVGLRCRAVAGSVDTLANTITIATGLNQARFELVWQQNSDMTCAELAANAAAIYSLQEQSLGAVHTLNFDGFGNDAVTDPLWVVPAASDGTNPSRTSIKSALLNGITPLNVVRPGVSSLVKRITTRSLNGSVPDYRIRDSHKVTVSDVYADDASNKAVLQFSGMVIGNDPAKGQQPPTGAVLTPRVFLAMLNGLTAEFGNANLVQNPQAIISGTICVRETSPSTRISAMVPLQPVDCVDQIGIVVNQVA